MRADDAGQSVSPIDGSNSPIRRFEARSSEGPALALCKPVRYGIAASLADIQRASQLPKLATVSVRTCSNDKIQPTYQ
jgi:hypothetical protein